VVEHFEKPDRDMDQRVPVAPAGFDQKNARRAVLAQPVGEDTAGRAGTDDDIVSLYGRSSTPAVTLRLMHL
jgi:hypothetical protein